MLIKQAQLGPNEFVFALLHKSILETLAADQLKLQSRPTTAAEEEKKKVPDLNQRLLNDELDSPVILFLAKNWQQDAGFRTSLVEMVLATQSGECKTTAAGANAMSILVAGGYCSVAGISKASASQEPTCLVASLMALT